MRTIAQALIARATGTRRFGPADRSLPLAPSYLNPAFRDKHALAYLSTRLAARKRQQRRARIAAGILALGCAGLVTGLYCISSGDHATARAGVTLALGSVAAFLFIPRLA